MKDGMSILVKILISDDYKRKAISIARNHGIGRDDAEDLYQDFSVKVITGSENYDPLRSTGAYLNTILRNMIIDRFRANNREKRKCVKNESNAPLGYDPLNVPSRGLDGPSVNMERAEKRSAIAGILDKLPEMYARILDQRYFEQMSYIDIAGSNRIRLGTMKSRLTEAKKLFRRHAKRTLELT